MESDQPESEASPPVTTGVERRDPTPAEAPSGPPDPAALVDRLIEAGEWPEPALIEQIAAAGEAALGPLLDFIRTYPSPDDYRREIVLINGIGILSMIRSPATIPDLVEIIERYPADSGEFAAEVLGDFGAIAFEPALELIRDPQVTGYRRRHAINAALRAAGTDPALRARLADVLRPLLADALERTREEVRQYAEESDEDDEEGGETGGWVLEDLDHEESFDDEDEDEEDLETEDGEGPSKEPGSAADEESPDASATGDLEPYEELMFLISDLADLADPQARDMINAAFEEDLVATFWVDKRSVDESYRKGGEPPRPRRDWLEDYRRQYRDRASAYFYDDWEDCAGWRPAARPGIPSTVS